MYRIVVNRFHTQGHSHFPMAGLLLFWGSVQNGFWAFGHNPVSCARKIGCLTLLLYGEKGEKVERDDIDAIFINLGGKKVLRTYSLADHENYLRKYAAVWTADVKDFLSK